MKQIFLMSPYCTNEDSTISMCCIKNIYPKYLKYFFSKRTNTCKNVCAKSKDILFIKHKKKTTHNNSKIATT